MNWQARWERIADGLRGLTSRANITTALRSRTSPTNITTALRNRTPRERVVIVGGALFVTVAILYTQLLSPMAGSLNATHAAVATEREILARERAMLASADRTAAQLDSVRRIERDLSGRFVSAANAPLAEAAVIDLIEKTAAASETRLESVRGVPNRPVADAPTSDSVDHGRPFRTPISVMIAGEGDLRGIVTFLHRIESGPVFLRLNQLALDPEHLGSSPVGPGQESSRPTGLIRFTAVVEGFQLRSEGTR